MIPISKIRDNLKKTTQLINSRGKSYSEELNEIFDLDKKWRILKVNLPIPDSPKSTIYGQKWRADQPILHCLSTVGL